MFKQTHTQNRKYGFGIWQAVQQSWEERNKMVLQSERQPLQAGSVEPDSICLQHGTCVCSDPGFEALHYHSQWVALLGKPHLLAPRAPRSKAIPGAQPVKKAKPPKTPHRVLMEQGFFVVRAYPLEGAADDPDDSWSRYVARAAAAALPIRSALADAPEAAQAAASEDLRQSLWYHVGYINFQNWRFSCTPLQFLFEDEAGIHLEAVHPLQSQQHVDFLKDRIDFRKVWVSCYYTIKSTEELLARADMIPAHVLVQPYRGIPTLRVWLGRDKEKQRRESSRKASMARSSETRGTRRRPVPGRGRGRGRGPTDPEIEMAVDAVAEVLSGSEASDARAREADIADVALDAGMQSSDEEPAGLDVPDPVESSFPEAGHERPNAAAPSSSARPTAAVGARDSSAAAQAKAKAASTRSGTEQVVQLGSLGSLHFYPRSGSFSAFCNCRGQCGLSKGSHLQAVRIGPERVSGTANWPPRCVVAASREAHGS